MLQIGRRLDLRQETFGSDYGSELWPEYLPRAWWTAPEARQLPRAQRPRRDRKELYNPRCRRTRRPLGGGYAPGPCQFPTRAFSTSKKFWTMIVRVPPSVEGSTRTIRKR